MLSSILAFTVVAALLTIAPGPDVALVLRTSIAGSWWHAVASAAGICTGCFAWGLASALGITAVLATSPILYAALRIAGALYLCFLGIQALRQPVGSAMDTSGTEGTAVSSRMAAFRAGLLTNLLNPKVGVFYMSLLPGFVPQGTAVLPMTMLLVGIHAVLGMVWLGLVAALVDRARALISRGSVRLLLNRLMGCALVGFGVLAFVDTFIH